MSYLQKEAVQVGLDSTEGLFSRQDSNSSSLVKISCFPVRDLFPSHFGDIEWGESGRACARCIKDMIFSDF